MNKKIIKGIIGILALCIFALTAYNFFCNRGAFLQVNAINCLSAFIVIGVSFFLVQNQMDYRKQKDIFIELLKSLRDLVDDDRSYNFNNIQKEEMLMRLRDISFKVSLIKDYSSRFELHEDDINFLEEKLQEYQSVIDGHATDMDLLRKLHNELKRPLNLISQKTFKIILDLYD